MVLLNDSLYKQRSRLVHHHDAWIMKREQYIPARQHHARTSIIDQEYQYQERVSFFQRTANNPKASYSHIGYLASTLDDSDGASCLLFQTTPFSSCGLSLACHHHRPN